MKTKHKKSCSKKGCNTRKYKKGRRAIAILDNQDIKGIIKFAEATNSKGDKGVRIRYDIKGLKAGDHGFHIHEYGDLSHGCSSACDHFNPYNKKHGGLNTKESHLGDLGNVRSKNNIARGSVFKKGLSLGNNKTSAVGRMIIVHSGKDDLGKGGNPESLKTGNAGSRIACAVIGLTN